MACIFENREGKVYVKVELKNCDFKSCSGEKIFKAVGGLLLLAAAGCCLRPWAANNKKLSQISTKRLHLLLHPWPIS